MGGFHGTQSVIDREDGLIEGWVDIYKGDGFVGLRDIGTGAV